MVSRYFYSSVLAKVFSTACTLVTGIASFRLFRDYLSPSEFAVFNIALQIFLYMPLMDGGIRMLLNCRLLGSELPEERAKLIGFGQKFFSWLTLVVAAVVCLVMMGLWVLMKWRGSDASLVFFMALAGSFSLLFVTSTQGNFLPGIRAQNLYYWILGFSNLVNFAILAITLQMQFRLWSFVFANVAMFLFSWPVYIWLIKAKVPGFRVFDFRTSPEFWQEVKRMRKDAFDSFRTQLSIFMLYSIDLVIVGVVVPLKEAGIYILLARILAILRGFIQTLGEVSWPLMAQNKGSGQQWSVLLLRVNAWIYGAVSGALAVTLLAFLHWFMGKEWTASPLLLGLMTVRFLIAGLQNPAGYYLISVGRFGPLARCYELELIAAVAASIVFSNFGLAGIAGGFLAATAAGTLYRIYRAYAEATGLAAGRVLREIWLRALAACAISAAVSVLVMPYVSGPFTIIAAAAGTATAILLPVLVVYVALRKVRGEEPLPARDILVRI